MIKQKIQNKTRYKEGKKKDEKTRKTKQRKQQQKKGKASTISLLKNIFTLCKQKECSSRSAVHHPGCFHCSFL